MDQPGFDVAPQASAASVAEHELDADDVPSRPRLIVFDVNETLSDMSGLATCFAELGLPRQVAPTWFAGLLRDGFALTVTGENVPFTELASESLRCLLTAQGVSPVDQGVELVMHAFRRLPLHPDVVEGVRRLGECGIRLVTLSNGPASVAQGLLERNGLADSFERLLSVEDAPAWKPAPAAYGYALETCGARPAETMLVAVHPWDIHGAHVAGLRTAFINRTGASYPRFFDQPDVEVENLVGLAQVLAGRSSA